MRLCKGKLRNYSISWNSIHVIKRVVYLLPVGQRLVLGLKYTLQPFLVVVRELFKWGATENLTAAPLPKHSAIRCYSCHSTRHTPEPCEYSRRTWFNEIEHESNWTLVLEDANASCVAVWFGWGIVAHNLLSNKRWVTCYRAGRRYALLEWMRPMIRIASFHRFHSFGLSAMLRISRDCVT